MKLILIILSCLIGIGSTNVLSGKVSLFDFGVNCLLTKNAGNEVICVSKTQFVMSYEDPRSDIPLSCPAGTYCVATAEICSSTGDPVCLNDFAGSKGACNACYKTVDGGYSPICISKTDYAFCLEDRLIATMKYKCAPPTSYCKAVRDSTGKLTGICTSIDKNLDC